MFDIVVLSPFSRFDIIVRPNKIFFVSANILEKNKVG